MNEVFELEPTVIAVPQCDKALLVHDDRAFDAEMVRGALVLLNLCLVGRTQPLSFSFQNSRLPSRQEATAIANKAFGWVSEVVRRRAEAAGMPRPLPKLQWIPPTAEQVATCTDTIPLFTAPKISEVEHFQFQLHLGPRALTMDKWFNEVMNGLPIYSWYRYKKGSGVRMNAIPLLTGVQQCMAYAVGVAQIDRWEPKIKERIRMCPYRYPHGADRRGHYFLDYRISANGRLEKNRQIFCCPEHANRSKQRKHQEKKQRQMRGGAT